MKAIINGKLVLGGATVEGMTVRFHEKICAITTPDRVEKTDEVIDAQGLFVLPGLVDMHIHGYLGEDASDGSEDPCMKIMLK